MCASKIMKVYMNNYKTVIAVIFTAYVITFGLCGKYDVGHYFRFMARILANPRQYNVTLLRYTQTAVVLHANI